jgi:hypothetical protein
VSQRWKVWQRGNFSFKRHYKHCKINIIFKSIKENFRKFSLLNLEKILFKRQIYWKQDTNHTGPWYAYLGESRVLWGKGKRMTYFDMYWVGEGIHNLKILFGRTD